MAGSISYATGQWLVLKLLATHFPLDVAGRYVYYLAVLTPISILCNFGLRNAIASDAGQVHRDVEYQNSRWLGLLVFALLSSVFILFDSANSLIITLVSAIKITDSISELVYGSWIRSKQPKLYGVSQFLRLTGFVGLFYLAKQFFGPSEYLLFAFPLSMLLVFLGFDKRFSRIYGRGEFVWAGVLDVLRESWFLALASFLAACAVSIPRFFVKHNLGDAELAKFALLIYFCSVAAMFVTAQSQLVIPYIAANLKTHNHDGLKRVVSGHISATVLYSALFAGIVISFGERLVDLLYGADGYEAADFILSGLGGFSVFLYMAVAAILTAAREFKLTMFISIANIGLSVLLYAGFVIAYEARGAYAAYFLSSTLSLLMATFGARSIIKRRFDV